ncbi:MAG: enoyl-CoA hydratase/isomerase family protein, partial [Candidatus Obscuribacterales bacterium]|nr:enoyl-CoA hydratase/isomerase family protein [Candidatus Obscuribacterales bacterium]
MKENTFKALSRGKAVELSVLNNGVAVIKFDLEDSKVNKLSSPVMAEFDAALDTLAGLSGVRGLVICSGKKDIFIAGADLDEVAQIQKMSPTVAFEAAEHGKAVFAKIAALPYPTVAAVDGACLGGGSELILACKYRLAGNSRKTKFGFPEVLLGFIPGWGGSVRLPKLVGAQAALDLILQPLKTWDADKAWRNGMVSEVVPSEKLFERAVAVALGAKPRTFKKGLKARVMRQAMESKPFNVLTLTVVAALAGGLLGALLGGIYGAIFSSWTAAAGSAACWFSGILATLGAAYANFTVPGRSMLRKGATAAVYKETKGNYPAPLEAVKVAMAAIEGPTARAFEMESNAFARLATGQISQNLVKLFSPTSSGNKAQAALPKTIGVLGCGTMGSGIVQLAAFSGFNVVARDPYEGAIERSKATVKGLFDKLVERKSLTQEEADAHFARITFVKDDLAPLVDCDLIIEAVIEDVPSKHRTYLEVEKVLAAAGKKAIIATNTSSLSVSKLGSCLQDQTRFAGLHFFNPVHAMRFVEVIRGEQTSDETVAVLHVFSAKLGKTTRAFKDSAGFAVNRILAPYMYEAVRLFEEGVPAEEIEKAMTKFGMPMGPLALMDEVGLDICGNVVNVMNGALGARVRATELLSYIKTNKLLGKKSGKGFYVYDENKKSKGLNPELAAQVKKAPAKKKPEEIADRMVLAMVNEAALCMEEGVAEDAFDINLAMVLGSGWAPFRGGPLGYADSLGARVLLQKLEALYQATGNENYKPA